jgi:hypothetical protein
MIGILGSCRTAIAQEADTYNENLARNVQTMAGFSDENSEQGDFTHATREFITWAPRIYPSGNFNEAYKANTEYVESFADEGEELECGVVVDAKWEQLGPVGNMTNTPTVGQIHRITFHPSYDGARNRTVYASSGFCGLWVSDDGGAGWTLMNTDRSIPFSGVADVALSADGRYVFIATGYPDGTIYGTYQPNISSVNPLFTQGVYRSSDHGATWEAMNNGLMDSFRKGGVIRRIIADPYDDAKLAVATSNGIFYCHNADAERPVWNKGVMSERTVNDPQLRGLEYDPMEKDVLYAAGSDIYRSVNGGVDWERMTGKGFGFDMDDPALEKGGFIPLRTNLAISPSQPHYLYAYMMGRSGGDNKTMMLLARFINNKWQVVTSHKTSSNFDLYSQSYMAIAVDPHDPDHVYWGNTIIHSAHAIKDSVSEVETFMGYATRGGAYVDIHSLVFEPVRTAPRLFAANHGGVSVYDFDAKRWNYSNHGICNATIWSFDDNDIYPDDMIIALQDHGIRTHQEVDGELQWKMLNTGGDGYSARIFDDVKKTAYHSNTWRALYDYDFKTGKIRNITRAFPKDHAEPGSNPDIFFTNSFACELHPDTYEPYLGFSEVYRKVSDKPTPQVSWQVESDVGKTIKPKWQRQINELAISNSNPDVIYLSTMGVDNGSNPDAKWHLNPRLFKSVTGFLEGNWSENRFREVRLGADGSGIRKISGNVELPPVTGIAIHPQDAEKVWITFTGYSSDHKIFRSDDGGTTWVNEDPDRCLLNLPVNGVVYTGGPDNKIFIATDAGVYMKSDATNWMRYGDIPNVSVVEIKHNKCSNTLKAATFGRGVFEVQLPESAGTMPESRIHDDKNWNSKRYLVHDLRIMKGARMIISDTLLLPANGRITIEKGGELVLDGGVVMNNCGQEWDGIYLEDKRSGLKMPDSKALKGSRNGVVCLYLRVRKIRE